MPRIQENEEYLTKVKSFKEAQEKWLQVEIGRSKDLSNTEINNIKILYRITPPPINKGRYSYWLAECHCGCFFPISSKNILNGNTKSCGCLSTEHAKKIAEDRRKETIKKYLGKKFFHWTVIDVDETMEGKGVYFICECDCKNHTRRSMRAYSFEDGRSCSCGCANIKSYGELCISKILEENNINYKKEQIFDDCINPKTNKPLRFDFYINNQYLIEYDGRQHFQVEENGYVQTEEELKDLQFRDNIKNQYCQEHHIPLIRIPYTHLKIKLEDLQLETSNFIM